jgi:hypothetical protein
LADSGIGKSPTFSHGRQAVQASARPPAQRDNAL